MKTCLPESYHPCKTIKARASNQQTTPSASQSVSKRRKLNHSVKKSICLENLGSYWVIYISGRGRCEVCSKNKVESRPHNKCSVCGVFLCCNEKIIAFFFMMKYSTLSFEDTMVIGILNFVEHS